MGEPSSSSVTRATAEATLTRTFGDDRHFRAGQWEAIDAALRGQDSCVFLATGAGKSLCYQLPPLLVPGTFVLVVSPLLALMEEQVAALRSLGVAAASISSARSASENRSTRELLQAKPPGLTHLYVSPELAVHSKLLPLLARLAQTKALCCVAVDEALCISQ